MYTRTDSPLQDPTWSAGPPTIDSQTFVRSIEIFTGYAPETSGETCTSALGIDAENGAGTNVMKLSVENLKQESTSASSAARAVLQVFSAMLAVVAWAVQA